MRQRPRRLLEPCTLDVRTPQRWCASMSSGRWRVTPVTALLRDLNIVNEPRLAEAGRRQHNQMRGVRSRRAKVLGPTYRKIIRFHPRLRERLRPGPLNTRKIDIAATQAFCGGLQ